MVTAEKTFPPRCKGFHRRNNVSIMEKTFQLRCKGFPRSGNVFSAVVETCYENQGYRKNLHVPYGPRITWPQDADTTLTQHLYTPSHIKTLIVFNLNKIFTFLGVTHISSVSFIWIGFIWIVCINYTHLG